MQLLLKDGLLILWSWLKKSDFLGEEEVREKPMYTGELPKRGTWTVCRFKEGLAKKRQGFDIPMLYCMFLLKQFVYQCLWTSSTMLYLYIHYIYTCTIFIFLCIYNMCCTYYFWKNLFTCVWSVLASLFYS